MAHRLIIPLVLSIAGCEAETEDPVSEKAQPLVDFPVIPPDVNTTWPCPPFAEVDDFTQDRMGDDDGDGLTDCQEDIIGSDSDLADTDGDGVLDGDEIGRLVRESDEQTDERILRSLLNTDNDELLNIVDPDDDNDGVPTFAEDLDGDGDRMNDDSDEDGRPNYLDDDDDNDFARGPVEDAAGSGPGCANGLAGDGDPSNDDFDCDGTPNYLDDDDDDDTAIGCEDSAPDGIIQFDPDPDDGVFKSDDVDKDGILDPFDPDDDGDGIPTRDEDADGDNNPCNDDLDGDGRPDFRDLDEDGDGTDTNREDLNGNSVLFDDDADGDRAPNFRDTDDDNDGVTNERGLPTNDMGNRPSVRNTDTDSDGIPDYLDVDDDGDGCRTSDEDLNRDGDPTNDLGTNKDLTDTEIPLYLDPTTSDCNATRYDAVLTGTGFVAENGARVYARIVDLGENDGTPMGGGEAVIADDGFTITFPLAVEELGNYSVDYYIDLVVDGICDDVVDASYELTGLTAAAGILEIATAAGTGTSDTCIP